MKNIDYLCLRYIYSDKLKPSIMKQSNLMQVTFKGNVPESIKCDFEKYHNQGADKQQIQSLDSEIEFYVVDIPEAYGNVNRYGKSAWLTPRDGSDSWSVSVSWS